VNGYVSLEYPLYPGWYPFLHYYYYLWGWGRRTAVIAPYWTDIDLRFTEGKVYLGHISRSSAEEIASTQEAEVFDAVQQLVIANHGDVGFLPTEVITVTWSNVSPYPGYYYSYMVRLLLTIYASKVSRPKYIHVDSVLS